MGVMLRCVLALLFLSGISGCIPDPLAPDRASPDTFITSGVIVVNEGLWRQDNATLTAYDPVTGVVIQDYFALKNPGLRLGDIANSITAHEGRGYIAVSTSQNVEVIDLRSGSSLGRLHLSAGNEPRQIAFADDKHAYVTTLLDSLIEFDPGSLRVLRSFPTGPAPEGVAVAHGRVFVANSGFGYYRQEEPYAGTLAMYDPSIGRLERSIRIGPNPRAVRYLPLNDRLYVIYGLAFEEGGLVELDPVTFRETRRWNILDPRGLDLDRNAGLAYVIASQGVVRVNLLADGASAEPFIPGSQWPNTIFHSLGVAPNGLVYLGAVRGYTTPGEVLIVDHDGTVRDRFPTDLNPKDYAFF